MSNYGSMIYLNNYLSIMFNISDVLIDKEEIAMKMKLPIYIPKETPEEETAEPETVCVSETVTDAQITVSNPIPCVPISHIRYMVKKSRQTPGYTRDFLLSLPPDQVYIISLIRLQG